MKPRISSFILETITCLFILSSSYPIVGQDKIAIDGGGNDENNIAVEIQNRLESVLDGSLTVSSIMPLVENLCIQDPLMALQFVQKILDEKKKNRFTEDIAKLQYYKTWLLLEYYSGNEELELLYAEAKECETYFKDKNKLIWLTRCFSLLSIISYNRSFNNDDSLFIEASLYNDLALNAVRRTSFNNENSYSLFGEIYRIRGNICLKKKDCPIDTALLYYQSGLDYYKLNNDKSGQADVLLNMAIFYAEMDSPLDSSDLQNSPVKYFENAISLCEQINDLQKIRLEFAIFLQNRYRSTRNPDWYHRSMAQLQDIFKSPGSIISEANFQSAMNTQSFLSYSAATLSEDRQNALLDSVIYFYQQTLLSCKAENNLKIYNEIFNRLAISCPYFPKEKCTGLLKKADETKTYFLQTNKAINQKITKRNEAFRKDLELERWTNMLLRIFLFLMILIAIFYWLYHRQKLRNLKSVLILKQEALSAQMNPHFISNTINAIDSLVNQRRNDEASEYLIDFSRLCRLIIDQSKASQITLKDEVGTLKYFLSLEKLRLGDDLEYFLTIDSQLDMNNVLVPPLLLQPVVENAIWHGIMNKAEPKKGELKIEVNKLSDERIQFVVEDNGVGREKAKAIQKESIIDQKSWGMTLTRERILLLEKNNNAQLKFIDLLDDLNRPRGTMVKIQLPLTYKQKMYAE